MITIASKNVWKVTKTVFRGQFVALNVYIKMIFLISDLSFYLNKLEKEVQIKRLKDRK